ncbi:hypothetical protein [Sporosarcina sp. FSL K6-3457]|uniref:hypothetical protein n=1 Tax=Sporosarcina sp. FSL K6-3457 TaxID=2978204 RepID=UPI0030F761BD
MDLLLQRIEELTPEQHSVFTYRIGMDVLQQFEDKAESYTAKDFEGTANFLIRLVTTGKVK